MNIMLALSLAYSGFASLCLAMPKHYRQVWAGHAPPTTLIAFRVVGWLCLASSFLFCIRAWGMATGVVGWFGVLTAVGTALTFLLPYVPRTAAALGGLAPIVTGLSTLVQGA